MHNNMPWVKMCFLFFQIWGLFPVFLSFMSILCVDKLIGTSKVMSLSHCVSVKCSGDTGPTDPSLLSMGGNVSICSDVRHIKQYTYDITQ